MRTDCHLIDETTLTPIKPADFGVRWCVGAQEERDSEHPKHAYRQQRIVDKIDAPAFT
jgi:hypothetical protein